VQLVLVISVAAFRVGRAVLGFARLRARRRHPGCAMEPRLPPPRAGRTRPAPG
jgi:hypothetical protein